ncbi:MAG: molecular chaperone DnaJ [bacterium]|nr:molecular chaperone DnaJ [bacterium]
MRQNKDYYEILGVARDATQDEIKKAFRKLSLKFHPDRNLGNAEAEEKYKEISEAYSVLSDSEKRSRYDNFGSASGPGMGFDFGDIFEDIFGDFFGSKRQSRNRPRKGADLHYKIDLTLKEVAVGVEKEIEVSRLIYCEMCNGSGAKAGTNPEVCPVCNGTGQVKKQNGFFTIATTCIRCGGQGSIIKEPCEKCHGTGKTRFTKKIKVKIPRGIEEGTRVRIAGEGDAGMSGGPPGDLYIAIFIEEHEIFKRRDFDLFCEVPITFIEAALGTAIEIPNIFGEPVKVEITKGTQTGDIIKITGQGLSNEYDTGDLFVSIFVETPTKLNKTQEALLKQFAEVSGIKIHPKTSNFWKKIKKIIS